MESIGTIISIDKNIATVVVKRTSACGENCANCMGSCETTNIKSCAENTVGAKVGDTVKIESNSTDIVRVAFILYIVPILVAILVAIFTYGMKISDIVVILMSVVSFFVSFLIIKRFEKRLVPKAYVTKILGEGVN